MSTGKRSSSPIQKVADFFRSFTIEPVIFMGTVGAFLVIGAEIDTNLLMWKVCKVEMGVNETICDDLTAEENEDLHYEVQQRVNYILLIYQWVGSAPAIFYSLFIGSLSDDVGRKPLMLFPTIGQVLSSVALIVNYAYIETLPTEFYYVTNIWCYFGGQSVYYLGYYGYGASITTPKQRATRLARFDGAELFGQLVGTAASPLVFSALGYYGIYVARLVIMFASVVYLALLIKEPLREKKTKDITGGIGARDVFSWWRVPVNFVKTYVVIPFKQMLTTVFKRREKNLRLLILVQLAMYGMYWFLIEEQRMFYLYLNNVFEGFEGPQNAALMVYTRFLGMFSLFVITPLLSLKLKMHEGLILTLVSVTVCLGTLIEAFAVKIWQIAVGEFFKMMWKVQFGAANSQFTKCIGEGEVGKLYSAVAFLAAVMPTLGNPVFRGLYDKTIDTFPSAYLLLAAAIILVLAVSNFAVYTQRSNMLVDRKGKRIKDEDPDDEVTRF